MEEVGCYINGRFVRGGAARFETSSPATGKALAQIAPAGVADVRTAIAAARRAAPDWRKTTPDMRAAWLLSIAEELEARSEELAGLETDDTGLILTLTTNGHLPRAAQSFRYFAALVTGEADQAFPLGDSYVTWVRREPLGVVGVVAPWNAPLAVASFNTAAALATGNCVILKPSNRSPLSSQGLAEIAATVGLPPGVFQVLQGGPEVGRQLAADDDIDGICFVGGIDAGREVLAAGVQTLKRVTLELGGKSPTLLFADCDFEAALDGALLSAFSSNGEVCAAGSRILVERPLYKAFVEALSSRAARIRVGDPRSPNSEMGPLIDSAHAAHVDGMVQSALLAGARTANSLDRGRIAGGAYYPPIVLDQVTPEMRITREEVFGPVTAVMPFSDEAEAVAITNDTPFGLHASVWSSDISRALRVANALDAGSVAVNAALVRDIRAPFGGRKLSGLGRTGGRWSLDAFSEPKSIALAISPYSLPRLGTDTNADERHHAES